MNNISKYKEIIVDCDSNLYIDGSRNIHITSPCLCNIYFLTINKSTNINIYLDCKSSSVNFYFSSINIDDNKLEVNVYHNAEDTISHVYNHGVNLDNNKLDFSINGYIPKKSVNANCNQDNEIINIRDGKSTICPRLYIDCYDSNSSHSAYIGRFRNDDLFYLESRGLDEKEAYKLLIKSFLIPSSFENKDEYVKKINEVEGDLFE